jgi:hypothetical protein
MMFISTGFAIRHARMGVLLAILSGSALAQQNIYTCVDARGRKLTSDRPIPECNDREQRVLNPSGTVKTKVGPTLTAQEYAELESRQKLVQEEQARTSEEKRRDRALLIRYPSRTVHDKERAEALAVIGVVKQAALKRIDHLNEQRTGIMAEMEFYKKDPSKAPASLRRQVDEVSQNLTGQATFMAEQDAEIKRINARFDEELLRLNQLWAMQSNAAPAINKTR